MTASGDDSAPQGVSQRISSREMTSSVGHWPILGIS